MLLVALCRCAGAAFLGDQLLTVGADGNICVWGLTAAHSPMRSDPALPAAAAGAAGEVGQEQQQEQCRQQQQQQLGAPEGCSTLRNWLEPRSSRVPGAVAVGVDGGVAVAQQQPLLVDEGIEPSPLFSEPAFQQQQQQQLLPGAATAPARRVDPLLSCSAVLGLDASRCGVLWLKQAGLLAYPASNTLILFDLATRQQSLLSHHQQRISAVAVSVDGQLVATGSAGTEQAGGYADVAVWDVQQRRLLMLLQQHPVCVEQLAFSPDGAWLASVGSGRVVVWQVTTGRATAVGGVKQVGRCCVVVPVSFSAAVRGTTRVLPRGTHRVIYDSPNPLQGDAAWHLIIISSTDCCSCLRWVPIAAGCVWHCVAAPQAAAGFYDLRW